MKSNFFFPGMLLMLVLLLAACGTAPTVTPNPTANPTPTTIPSPMPVMATITFENNKCTYDGPQPIPARPSITVNWVIKDKDRTKYGLYVFTLNEGKTREDLMAAANDPTPPSWAPIAGSAESTPNTSRQMTVNTQKGPLYFTCWSSPPDTMFQVIGPIAVEGMAQTANFLPTADALTITFENHECTYDGPRPIPAGREIPASAIIKDTNILGPVPVVGITALTINEGHTTQEVEEDFRRREISEFTKPRGVLRSWLARASHSV